MRFFGSLCRFNDTFKKLSSLDLAQKGVSIEIFHTGKISNELTDLRLGDSSSAKSAQKGLEPCVKVFSGRPTIEAQLETVSSRHGLPFEDVAILACGPAPMVEGVQRHAVKMGCAFHKETFLL